MNGIEEKCIICGKMTIGSYGSSQQSKQSGNEVVVRQIKKIAGEKND